MDTLRENLYFKMIFNRFFTIDRLLTDSFRIIKYKFIKGITYETASFQFFTTS